MTQTPEAGDLRARYPSMDIEYIDGLQAHIDEGGHVSARNVSDLIAMVRWNAERLIEAMQQEQIATEPPSETNDAALSPAPSQGDVGLRVARAIYDDWRGDPGLSSAVSWEELGPNGQAEWHGAARAAIAAMPVSAGLDPDGYLWKWVERGLFDPQISAKEALSVIANHPAAPWKRGRWDVDHKPYAAKFYERFPKAALSDDDGKEGR